MENFKNYLIEQEKSSNTISSYLCAVRQFRDTYSIINKDNLIAYKSSLMNRYKPSTTNAKICAINEYLRFSGSSLSLKCVKVYKRVSVENVITLAEYQKIRDGLLADEKLKHYFLIRFLAETGCRVNELTQFRAEHIRQGYAELFTKGKVRRIYIPDKLQSDTLEWLHNTNKSRGFIFVNGSGDVISRNGVFRLLRAFAERYNVSPEVVHPHSFRHMFALEFLKRDNDISLLSNLLGHESISTTSIYLQLSADEQRKRINNAVEW